MIKLYTLPPVMGKKEIENLVFQKKLSKNSKLGEYLLLIFSLLFAVIIVFSLYMLVEKITFKNIFYLVFSLIAEIICIWGFIQGRKERKKIKKGLSNNKLVIKHATVIDVLTHQGNYGEDGDASYKVVRFNEKYSIKFWAIGMCTNYFYNNIAVGKQVYIISVNNIDIFAFMSEETRLTADVNEYMIDLN